MFDKHADLRERHKIRASLTLKDCEPIEGYFFCMSNERVNDLLNDERAFFPFETVGGELHVIAKSSVSTVVPKERIIEKRLSTDPYEILGVPPDATKNHSTVLWGPIPMCGRCARKS